MVFLCGKVLRLGLCAAKLVKLLVTASRIRFSYRSSQVWQAPNWTQNPLRRVLSFLGFKILLKSGSDQLDRGRFNEKHTEVRFVQELVGHEQGIGTTQNYMHGQCKLSKLKEEIEKLYTGIVIIPID